MTGTSSANGATLVGVFIGSLLVRSFCAGHGLPYILPPEDWVACFGRLGYSIGMDGIRPLADGVDGILLSLDAAIHHMILIGQGVVADEAGYRVHLAADPGGFWTAARLTFALLGSVAVLWVARHGRDVGERTGWVAAVLLMFSTLHVEASRQVGSNVVDALVCFGVVALLTEAMRGERLPSAWVFTSIGVAALLAGWPAPMLLVPYIFVLARQDGPRGEIRLLWPAGLAAGIAVVLDPIALVRTETWARFTGFAPGGVLTWAGELYGSQGIAWSVLALAGILLTIQQRRTVLLVHVVWVAAVAAASTLHSDVNAMTLAVLPSSCLLAAFALTEIVRRIPGAPPVPALVAAGLVLTVVAEPVWTITRSIRTECRADPRALAADWMIENAEHRAVVLVGSRRGRPAEPVVPVRNLRRNLRLIADDLESSGLDGATYWRCRADGHVPPMFDLRLSGPAQVWPALEEARAAGVEYAILRPSEFAGPATSDERRRFYEALLNDPDVSLRAHFANDGPADPRPAVEIWSLDGGDSP